MYTVKVYFKTCPAVTHIVLYLSAFLGFCIAAGRDNQGTEFIIGFMNNQGSSHDLELFVTTMSNTPADVTVTAPLFIPGQTLGSTTVSRGNIEKITLSNNLRGVNVERGNKGVLVTATQEITVFGVNKESLSTDGFVAFPTDTIGTEYFLITWSSEGQFVVIAVTDGTTVEIRFPTSASTTLSVVYDGVTYSNGDVLEISLNKYQTFHCYQSSGDFTGTEIVSNYAVTVFSGAKKVAVRDTFTGATADHLVEQMMPVSTWGKYFVTISTPDRTTGDYYRVVASEDSTTIYLAGVVHSTVNAREYVELDVNSGDYKTLTADKAVLVAMFGKSYSAYSGDGKKGGDPHMTVLPPVPQFPSDYTFSTVRTTTGEFTNYVLVVIDKLKTADLTLDNVAASTTWTSISGSDNLVTATFNIIPGSHSIFNNDPAATFMSIAFGNENANSYAYACGFRLALINEPCTLTLVVAGDIVDNDCDGWIDEETDNGIDDDNDGQIDEDLALPPRINGNWTSWSLWGTCSVTCGTSTGTEIRTRTCTEPTPANNGLDCSGSSTEDRSCSSSVQCPIDGFWGSWSAWTDCQVACGNGEINRTRHCESPVPQYGGAACFGNNTEYDTCWNGTCYPSVLGNIDRNCSLTYFGCKDGHLPCIGISFRCDGETDCDDGSDESAEIAGCQAETDPDAVYSLVIGIVVAVFIVTSLACWLMYIHSISPCDRH